MFGKIVLNSSYCCFGASSVCKASPCCKDYDARTINYHNNESSIKFYISIGSFVLLLQGYSTSTAGAYVAVWMLDDSKVDDNF